MHIKRRESSSFQGILKTPSPVLERLYLARGITSAEQLDKRLHALLPFSDLMGIDQACVRLTQAIREQHRLLIVGDFDADGATSSALAVAALRLMGATQVSYLVPNRFEFGYGLTPAIVDVAKQWQPDVIITVDNGISSVEGVDHANANGIDVVVTDHHLPGEKLPNACAIVNPNQVGDTFASKSIAGVGVIFYVMLALRRALSSSGWFNDQRPEPNMSTLLDLVALGTVADVVALDQNNRILVSQGLARIRQGFCRPGIRALIEISGRRMEQMKASDLGFAVAPRLNAAGRLDDMSLGIECLLTDNHEQAQTYAKELDNLNTERRKIETDMKTQALQFIETLSIKEDKREGLPIALCLFDDSWHQGVIGILAGRLKDRFHRPVIAFAKVSEQEMKGSARSVPGVNIRDVLTSVDREHPELISKFGGHAMAAGLSIHPEVFPQFQQALVNEVNQIMDLSQCEGVILSDGPLATSELTLDLAKLLQDAGPWGQQFPEPLFDNVFEILDQRIVGQNHLKLTLAHEAGGPPLDAIAFQVDLKHWPNHRATHLHAAYRLDINTFQGKTKLQLMITDLQVCTTMVPA